VANLDNERLEELGFIDRHNAGVVFQKRENFFGVANDYGVNAQLRMASDLVGGVAIVYDGLEDLNFLTGDLGPFDSADQFLGFTAEHAAADYFDPPAVPHWRGCYAHKLSTIAAAVQSHKPLSRLPRWPRLWFSLGLMEQVLSQSIAPSAVVRAGRWWFQRRGVSPLPLILLCLVCPPNFVLSPAQLTAVLFFMVLCEGARIWAVGYAGSATRTRGDRVPGLVHAGPFRHVRNPLYIANGALYTLCSIAFGFSWLSLLVAAYFAIQYSFIVAFEEDLLRREFGAAYEFYCARVARWLPAMQPTVEASGHRFDLRKALRSERASLLALALIVALMFAKRAYLQ
jgi:protein-S-isoprenylcysteine O-methyltransferase Ste14